MHLLAAPRARARSRLRDSDPIELEGRRSVSSAATDEASSAVREISLSISGMTCAACAARVEKKLNALDGVVAAVNFATERAHVRAPGSIPPRRLIEAVEQAGYGAEQLVHGVPGAGGAGRADAGRSDAWRADAGGADAGQVQAGPAAGAMSGAADGAVGAAAAYAGPDADRVADLRRRLIVAVVFFVPLGDLSVWLSLFPSSRFPGWQWVLVVLTVPVAGYAAWPFHRAAWRAARHGSSSMDTLVSLGITAACGWSVYAMFVVDRGQQRVTALQLLLHGSGGGIYLEVAASVTMFLLAGRWYEARARRDAGDAMRELAAARATDACVLADDGTEHRIPAADLTAGQRFVTRPGEAIAADGVVEFGQSAVDTSMMTGESLPAEVAEGDTVTGGTVVVAGRLVVLATAVGGDTQLAQLVALVEQAQSQKAAIQRLADRICGVFVPGVLVLSGLTLGGWLLAGSAAEHAFSAALAVLIIACPCALGLATPAALMVACGRGAQLGIFIKRYEALESSRAVDTVVLDKTGTVTTGMMAVTGVCPAPGVDRPALLRYAGAVEEASEHPVAAAISAAAGAELGRLPRADGFTALPGLGARGLVAGHEVTVGRADLFGGTVPAAVTHQCRRWEQDGCTVALAGWAGQVRGAIAVADTIKPSAAAAVAELRRLGLRTVLLTGDGQATARAVAAQAGIDEVIAGALPGHKVAVLRDLQARGHRVAMVGDGINDGPALAAADLGLALGTGTAVAMTAADLIVLRDDLGAVPDAIRLARATLATIRGNLAWAFGYNIAAIPLAAAGFLNPLIAGAAMAASSAFVVANSVRLRKFGAAPGAGPVWRARPHGREPSRSPVAGPVHSPGLEPAEAPGQVG
jgi:P-type Cu+ transporter